MLRDDERPPRKTCRASLAGQAVRHRPCRSAVAVRQPHRQDRPRASAPRPLPDADARRDRALPVADHLVPSAHCTSGCRTRSCAKGWRCSRPGGSPTGQHRLVQGHPTAAPTGAASASTSATSPRSCSSGSGAEGPHPRGRPPPGQPVATRKREHSRKPDELYPIIESCSPGPFLELFGRGLRPGWTVWGNQASADYAPDWETYAYTLRSAAE